MHMHVWINCILPIQVILLENMIFVRKLACPSVLAEWHNIHSLTYNNSVIIKQASLLIKATIMKKNKARLKNLTWAPHQFSELITEGYICIKLNKMRSSFVFHFSWFLRKFLNREWEGVLWPWIFVTQ